MRCAPRPAAAVTLAAAAGDRPTAAATARVKAVSGTATGVTVVLKAPGAGGVTPGAGCPGAMHTPSAPHTGTAPTVGQSTPPLMPHAACAASQPQEAYDPYTGATMGTVDTVVALVPKPAGCVATTRPVREAVTMADDMYDAVITHPRVALSIPAVASTPVFTCSQAR